VFGTTEARKGWTDLVATARNAAVDAWEFLSSNPTAADGDKCYMLKGSLGTVQVNGSAHQRWQYKTTRGGRIWYAVIAADQKGGAGSVVLERVTTGHPNQTVKRHR
jgi:hypothetical protein